MKDKASSANANNLDPININEEFVRMHVKKTMEELGACRCDTCFANACAIALNALKPKYVTTEKGALLTEAATITVSNQADILVEATKAVMQVMKNPHHNK
jgi:competence protein ComFB